MNHSFDVDMAVRFGIAEAVLVEHLRFWVQKNAANKKHFHDGHYWTYNSAKAFAEIFPYLSEDKVQRLLKKLETCGVVLTGSYNNNPYDRTRWYSISDEFMPANSGNPYRKNAESAFRKNAESSNTDINTDKKPATSKASPSATPSGDGATSQEFAQFWETWPKSTRKGAKGKCYAAWVRAGADGQLDAVLAHVEALKASKAWTDNGGQFIPAPLVYLNQRMWEGAEIEASTAPALVGGWV